jgi:hypothetical protein
MNRAFLGSLGVGKTSRIKDLINELKGKAIVLDFNNEYDGVSKEQFYLDKLNPVFGEITIDDVKAINAGYLSSSRCLLKTSEEILRETKLSKKEYLIEESVERLHISWDNAENMYAKILNSKIPLKRNRSHFGVDKLIEDALSFDKVLLKSKNMHSDHLRACAFLFLSKLSHTIEEPIHIVIDEQSTLLNQGNIKMFLDSVDFTNLNFIFCFNKISSIPKELLNYIDEFSLFRFNSSNEIDELEQIGINPDKGLKKLKLGKSVEVSRIMK